MLRKKKTKFIIFGQGRTGSNLLVGLLNSHPDIYCDRELLNNHRIARKNRLRRVLISWFPYQYIKYYLNKRPENIYGFKLMIYQLMSYRRAKSRLFDQSWKIIHLTRDNVLQQTFSALIAEKSGMYIRKTDDDEINESYHIDPQRVYEGILYRTKDMERENNILKGFDFLELNYEKDLENSDKWKVTTTQIFDYLGVPDVNVSSATLKTNSGSGKERISNYNEIMEHLKKTEFSYLIERFG